MSDAYETKTVRFHLEERGQHLYITLTRFTGSETILDEIGYTGEYIQFQAMHMAKQARKANTDLYQLAQDHPYPLTELYPFDLLYALDTEELEWGAISDGDKLTADDVDVLLEEVAADA